MPAVRKNPRRRRNIMPRVRQLSEILRPKRERKSRKQIEGDAGMF